MSKNKKEWKKISTKLDEALKPKQFNRWVKKTRGKKNKKQQKLFKEIDSWLKNGDQKSMAEFLSLLAEQHDETHREIAYLKNVEPAPNALLSALFEYAEKFGNKIGSPIESIFRTETYEFMNYRFEIVWGQGMVHTVYDPKDKVIISI